MPRYYSICLIFACVTSVPAAEENADLQRLREGYQKELAVAATPVRARYAEKLQALVKLCSQKGDLDGALQARNEIERLKGDTGAAAPLAPAVGGAPAAGGGDVLAPFRAALSGATFTWSHDGSGESRVTFLPDGTFKTPAWGGSFSWQVVSRDTVRLESEKFGTAKLTFNPTATAYEGEDFRTKRLLKGKRVDGGDKAPLGGAGGGAFGKPSP